MSAVKVFEDQKKALSKHELFKLINGNPYNIALASGIYQRDVLKKYDKNALVDVYLRMKSENNKIKGD